MADRRELARQDLQDSPWRQPGRPQGRRRRPAHAGRPLCHRWENPTSVAYRSMHISYPNGTDRARAVKAGLSPGGNIMIHGQYNGFGWASWLVQRFDWTSGCIAVTNAEMDEIISLVAPGTPIEITP
ncbi:MAG TPA: L,D-transpeptidase family protein [Mesorhizobium sp.]